MVAYSFKGQFRAPIKAKTKRQTIRAVGKRRHAKPGDELQLYVGMRTPRCELVKRTICKSAADIRIVFDGEFYLGTRRGVMAVAENCDAVFIAGGVEHTTRRALNAFARRDGFRDWNELREFWRHNHPGINDFKGVLIQW